MSTVVVEDRVVSDTAPASAVASRAEIEARIVTALVADSHVNSPCVPYLDPLYGTGRPCTAYLSPYLLPN